MHSSLLREFQQRRFSIRARWEALLRAEPITSPLANPDALAHLIDTTLEEIFSTLEGPISPDENHREAPNYDTPPCSCGRNPLLAYFSAGRQAVFEGLILSQAATVPLDPGHRDASLEELAGIVHEIAAREIEAFCGICQFRHLALSAPTPTLALCE